MTRIPDFFIVGYPRAATTSLYHYLNAHPQIFMPEEKEPHFFGRDLLRGENLPDLSEQEYLQLFSDADENQILGDGSVSTLFSKTAAEEIYAKNPKAKIIFSLRHPADACFSLYMKQPQMGLLGAKTFEKALEIEEQLHQGVIKPPSKTQWKKRGYWVLQGYEYHKNTLELPQAIRYFQKIFGENQVKIIFFDDIRNDTENTYRELVSFLGAAEDFKPDFNVHNEQPSSHFRWINNVTYKYRRITAPIKQAMPAFMLNALKRLKSLNKKQAKEKMKPETRARLIKDFTPAVKELEKITGRDLSAWLE